MMSSIFDFNPFVALDLNGDGVIDEIELKFAQLEAGHGFDLNDLNGDGAMDKFQADLNTNTMLDQFEVDFNQNTVLDQQEQVIVGTQLNVDLNGDGKIDGTDIAMAKYFFK